MAKDYSKIVLNPNEIPMWFGGFETAVETALAAGAVPPISFLGIGMSGWVFCDQSNMAFKVARVHDNAPGIRQYAYRLIEDEADFLTTARQLPEKIRQHVVRIHEWKSDLGVIKKACIWGKTGAWSDASHLHDLHMEIAEAMDPLGWGPPEFKEDSYILDSNNVWVLVDAGFVNRFGKRLADYAEDVVQGRFKTLIPLGYSEASDLAFAVKMDGLDKRIPEDQAYRLFLELKDLEDRLMKEDVARLSKSLA